MPCYECSKDPKYVCSNCGGLVCEEHGARLDDTNKCLCNRCPQATLAIAARQLVWQLSDVLRIQRQRPGFFGHELEAKLRAIDVSQLINMLRHLA